MAIRKLVQIHSVLRPIKPFNVRKNTYKTISKPKWFIQRGSDACKQRITSSVGN